MTCLELGSGLRYDIPLMQTIVQNAPHLRALLLSFPIFPNNLDTVIKAHCQKLKILNTSENMDHIDRVYDLLTEIPTLRTVECDDRTFHREDYYNIADYLKNNKIPYSRIGTLQNTVEKYSLEEDVIEETEDDSAENELSETEEDSEYDWRENYEYGQNGEYGDDLDFGDYY